MKKILNSLMSEGGRHEVQLTSGVIYQGEILGAADCLILKYDHTDKVIYINFDHIMSVRKS